MYCVSCELGLTGIFLYNVNSSFQRLVIHMIQKDPNERLSANDYLNNEKGKAFPEYFYDFMLSYMKSFSADPTMTPDKKMDR